MDAGKEEFKDAFINLCNSLVDKQGPEGLWMEFTPKDKEDGTIYYKNYIDGKPEDRGSICGSAVSFSGIIRLRLLELGEGEEFRKNVHRSARWVVNNRFAMNHPDMNLAGAFLNSRTRVKNGTARTVNRDVGTAFGIRFLVEYNYIMYGVN